MQYPHINTLNAIQKRERKAKQKYPEKMERNGKVNPNERTKRTKTNKETNEKKNTKLLKPKS